jgi:Bifunctional DNA primase/polymerase, N-terminal
VPRIGIDVKADGGYVVAPPSRHVSGDRYHFTRDNGFVLPELHSALRDLILPTEAQAHPQPEQSPKVALDDLRVSDGKALIRGGKP